MVVGCLPLLDVCCLFHVSCWYLFDVGYVLCVAGCYVLIVVRALSLAAVVSGSLCAGGCSLLVLRCLLFARCCLLLALCYLLCALRCLLCVACSCVSFLLMCSVFLCCSLCVCCLLIVVAVFACEM